MNKYIFVAIALLIGVVGVVPAVHAGAGFQVKLLGESGQVASSVWETCTGGSNITHIGKCVSEKAMELQEGRKGLNAVNVKVTGRAGDPSGTMDNMPEEKERGIKAGEIVSELAKKGDRLSLVGFGSFSVAKRNGRNPQTGKEIKIPAKELDTVDPIIIVHEKTAKTPNGEKVINIIREKRPL